MSITKERKQELMKEFSRTENDTGSVEVQVSILTERISNLTTHLKENKHDFASRRGLLMLAGRRRRLLNYLTKNDHNRYIQLISKLGIRK